MTEKIKAEFEQWYVENAFDYPNNPIGSRDCGLQRKAYYAAIAQERIESQKRKAELQERVNELEEAMDKIVQWSKAYPLSVFPEPDFKKAAQALKDYGMTLDTISAANMRHVLNGVIEIAGSCVHPDNAKE